MDQRSPRGGQRYRAAASDDERQHLLDALTRLDNAAATLVRETVEHGQVDGALALEVARLVDSAAAKVRRAT